MAVPRGEPPLERSEGPSGPTPARVDRGRVAAARRVDLDHDVVKAQTPPGGGIEAFVYGFFDREGNPGEMAVWRQLAWSQNHALDRLLERRIEQFDVEAHTPDLGGARDDGPRQLPAVRDAADNADGP